MMRERKSILKLVLIAVGVAASLAGPDATPSQPNDILSYLEQTRQTVVDTVQGLSEARSEFEQSPEAWSIADIVERIALAARASARN